MPRVLFRFLAVATLLLPSATSTAQTTTKPIAIIGVDVIPMDRERVLRAQSVIVERGVITRIGPAQSIRPPAGATIVDGKDKFLIPGLADMHVHLAGPVELQRALLQLFVSNGVTTVLNMRGAPEHLALRREVASSRTIGPTVYTVGPYVNEPFFRTADEVEEAVREQKRLGYDFIKMHGDLSRDAYARLNAVAREVGIRVIGHAPRNLGIEALFEERQYALAHAEEFIYDRNNSSRDYLNVVPRIPSLTRSMVRTETWLMPNLTAFKIIGLQVQNLAPILARPEMRFLPSAYRTGWGPATNPYTNRFPREQGPGIMARFEVLQQLAKGFQSGGVRMVVGTDALNTGVVPGFSVHDELAELVAAGLTPYQALRAGTANAAEFLGVQNTSGTVAAGRKADLVLLDANPLTDIANTRRITGVMLRGRWFSRAEIAGMLETLAAM
jgi:cytosine/adenosine deaminase-related metal-dependent hydrolase